MACARRRFSYEYVPTHAASPFPLQLYPLLPTVPPDDVGRAGRDARAVQRDGAVARPRRVGEAAHLDAAGLERNEQEEEGEGDGRGALQGEMGLEGGGKGQEIEHRTSSPKMGGAGIISLYLE